MREDVPRVSEFHLVSEVDAVAVLVRIGAFEDDEWMSFLHMKIC